MNQMFLSFLKSMQTKSQGAQNPGLWVNGNRMPMQEGQNAPTATPLLVADDNGEPAATGVDPALDTNKNTKFTNPDTGKALGDAYMSRWQERRDDEDKGINHENETPVDYTERKHEEEEDFVGPPSKLSGHNLYTKNQLVQEELTQDEVARRDLLVTNYINDRSRFPDTKKIKYTREPKPRESSRIATTATPLKKRVDTPESNKPKSLSDQKKKPMQENTNRSMFLTHLQGMQTNSQDAQNPGLWVNGNRLINPNC